MAPMIIETNRLTLRPLQGADAAMITLYLSDVRLARMTALVPHPYPPGSAASYITWANSPKVDGRVWAIGHRESDGELVGMIHLRADGEIGYWVGAPFQQSGFATEAVEAIVSHAFDSGTDALHAQVFQDNPASAKVLSKAGFTYTGEGDGYSMARDAAVPQWNYDLERETWMQMQSLKQSA